MWGSQTLVGSERLAVMVLLLVLLALNSECYCREEVEGDCLVGSVNDSKTVIILVV